MFTGRKPYCNLLDGNFPDKCEPKAQTIHFMCKNDRVIHFILIFKTFKKISKKAKMGFLRVLISFPRADFVLFRSVFLLQ